MSLFRRWASLLGCCLVVALLGAEPSAVRSQEGGAPDRRPAPGVAGVVVTGAALSVDVQEEDFSLIFRSVASQLQFDVGNLDGLPQRRITTQFADLPVMAGIKRLLRVAGVAGYMIVTAHSEDGVRIERVLFLDANVNASAGTEPRAASVQRMASRRARRMSVRSERARARRVAGRQQEEDRAPAGGLDDLRDNPETEQLLNQAVDADEQVRERAIEGLMRLAGGAAGRRELIEALGPHLDALRHGDEEAREEAREDILSMIRR